MGHTSRDAVKMHMSIPRFIRSAALKYVIITQHHHDKAMALAAYSVGIAQIGVHRSNGGAIGEMEKVSFQSLSKVQTRSTQRERDRLLGGHRRAFRPSQFICHIPKLSA